ERSGLIALWNGRIAVVDAAGVRPVEPGTDRYVGTPTMNSCCKHLLMGLETCMETHVGALDRVDDVWQLRDDRGRDLGVFSGVVVAVPAPQAAPLLVAVPALAARARGVVMEPCWAVMATVRDAWECAFDAAFVHDSRLSWIARDNSKPGRSAAIETWTLHGSAAWSRAHLESTPEWIAEQLTAEWRRVLGPRAPAVERMEAHRWRYAIPPEPLAERFLLDTRLRLGACGDWCGGPRVEGAYLSGMGLAEAWDTARDTGSMA
ncbi:MAG TPA: FAD-dependent oxidoreductase, partial [Pirellulaceae bacterium]